MTQRHISHPSHCRTAPPATGRVMIGETRARRQPGLALGDAP